MRGILLVVSFFFSFIFLPGGNRSFAQDEWEDLGVPFTGNIFNMAEAPDGTVFALARHNGQYSNVYRSVDQGFHWQNLDLASGYSCVAINSNGAVYLVKNNAVTRSLDNGDSWDVIFTGNGLTTIAISKEDVIAVGSIGWEDPYVMVSFNDGETWQTNYTNNYTEQMYLYFNSKEDLFMATENDLSRSPDYGENFSYITPAGATYEQSAHQSLAFGVNDEIYYGMSFGNGLFRSTDNGDSWDRVLNTGTQTIAVNSYNEVFAGPYRSEDGYNWSLMTEFAGTPVYKILIGKNNMIYVSTSLGISVSEDNGVTWRMSQQGLMDSEITDIQSYDEHIFLAKNGLFFHSADHGNSWKKCILPWPDYDIESLYISPEGDVFATCQYENRPGNYDVVLKSRDFGETWESFVHIPVGDLASGAGETMFMVSGLTLHRSEDNGVHWEKLTGVPECFMPLDMEADPAGTIYVNSPDCSNEVVYVSTDNGNKWMAGYLPEGARADRLQVNSKGDVYAQEIEGGLYITKDKGITWTQIVTQPWFESVMTLEIDSNDYLYVSSACGVFESGDDGRTWTSLNEGLPDGYNFFKLSAGESDYLFAATTGGKVFRKHLSEVMADNPDPGELVIYPNPAKDNFNLTLEGATRSFSEEISILDMAGRKVMSTPIYTSHARVDISALDAGVYVVIVNDLSSKLVVK